MTRAYELAVVINPTLSDAEIERYLHTVRQLVEKYKGKIVEEDNWGRRETAYKLGGHQEGYYIFFKIELPADQVLSLDQDLKLDHNVIRYLITLDETEKSA